MGVAIEMCTCSPQQAIIPNCKSNLENDGINQYNSNINNIINNNNNIENIKKKKKISNGVLINNEQSNDTETFKNALSNDASISTPKNKGESIYSQKVKKREKEKRSKKESDKKTNKSKNQKQENAQDNEEELELDNIIISDTVLSELIISEKISKIPKEKKKKIKGRNNINIIVIGFNEVGKSSFCIRFVENKFEDFYIPSICNENFYKMMVYNDHSYRVNFLVILGGEKIQKQDNILGTGDFFIFLYDITKIRSFNQINIYLKQLKKYLFLYDKEGKSPNFCLIGNKCDLEGERKVGLEIINKCIVKFGIKHFDISVRTAKNMNNLIQFFVGIFDKIAFSDK